MMFNNSRRTFFILAVLVFSSCAAIEDVKIKYDPIEDIEKNPQLESVIVDIVVEDEREDKGIIGKGPGRNKIKAKNDPALVIENSIKHELARKGFKVGKGDVLASIQLRNFYSKKVGEFLGADKNIIKIVMNVVVYDINGTEYYNKEIIERGEKYHPDVWSNDDNYRRVVNQTIYGIIEDRNFIDAIIKASKDKDMG